MTSSADKFAWVEEEFNRQAANGFLGDPAGRPAMAYLRVSSAGQAEEGRSGFPRQILHVSEKAHQLGLAIPWHLVFFDDHTGFEFRDRPNLTKLRELIRQPGREADDLVIENLDRLSREATWHQGFLLDEIEKACKVRVHFWKELGSNLERVVYGTIAQDRMRTDLERMATGNVLKAKSGRVTARTPAYGYTIVNAQGGKENAKKDSYYAIYEPEATVMRFIFRLLVKERYALHAICRQLIDKGTKPPKTAKGWDPSLIRVMISNPVYKGEFYAHRYTYVKGIAKRTGKETLKKIERPRNEWILVPVPALVPVEIWEEAQKTVRDNKDKSPRNAHHEYLLLGLTYCASCKVYKMSSGVRTHKKMVQGELKSYRYTCYRCVNTAHATFIRTQRGYPSCPMSQISSPRLDAIVWGTVVNFLFNRQWVEEALERYFSNQSVETTREEIAFVQSQMTEIDLEDEMLYRAYVAKAFDAEEFAQKRHLLKERKQRLQEQKDELEQRFSQQTTKEQRKQQIISSIEELKRLANDETPFELKRRIILKVVDKIIVNTNEEWFELEGAISGHFNFSSADTGSWQRPA